MEGGDKYKADLDVEDYRAMLSGVAARLELLAAGLPVGRPWDANYVAYVVTEIGRLAEEIRSVLNEGN
jgi:hypothetical protein